MSVIQIDIESAVPVYRQVADALRTVLVQGKLAPGDRLPTVRRLAGDLGVHHNTVAEAYRQLASEGWLDLGRRRGATVLERQSPAPSTEAEKWFGERLGELIAKARSAGVGRESVAGTLERLAREIRGI